MSIFDGEKILILDFGSQYTQLIARKIREQNVYAEIVRHDINADQLRSSPPKGIILSGGPSSIYDVNPPQIDPQIFDLNIPILGICYGMQLIVNYFGGKVSPSSKREYGKTIVNLNKKSLLFSSLENKIQVWMSHGDQVKSLPNNLISSATTHTNPYAAIEHDNLPIYGVQFHPEVTHTLDENKIITNFLINICKCARNWSVKNFIPETVSSIKNQISDQDHVICALSGGVDSSVVAALLQKAISNQLTCIFVNTGLLRFNEQSIIEKTFLPILGDKLRIIDAREKFLNALSNVSDPEEKRKIIGHTFIEVFQEEASKIKNANYLAQGTLYPDVIESISPLGGPSTVIKSHHNVGGLPEKLGFKLIEPLKFLFKDEVRSLGKELGLPLSIIHKQPFPGPGLAIRIIGEISEEKLKILKLADKILCQEVEKNHLDQKVWQYFAVLLPIRSVGVMGDKRTYDYTCVLRIVESVDGMTADWHKVNYNLLATISNRIINEVDGINRVCYDISSKPPATIEWE